MIEVRRTDAYTRWFSRLRDRQARARINIRVRRLSLGNFGDVRPVGGVCEKLQKTRTRPWDAVDYLETEQDIVAYLEAALDEGDPALIAAALGDIARAKGMTVVAADAGLGRESLYKALSPNGNPEFATVLKVMCALGLRLHASSAAAP